MILPEQGAPQLTLLIPEASPGFSQRAVSWRRNCHCPASLAALPLLIAGPFLLHGERSRA